MQVLLLLALCSFGSVAMATPFRHNCAEFNDCATCAAHLSWLGTSCRWCPIDRGCHEMGSLKNHCDEGHVVTDPGRCTPEKIKYAKFDQQLSHFAAVMAGAAYSPSPASCVTNFQVADPITDVEQVTVNCDLLSNNCSAFIGRSIGRKLLVLSVRGTHGKGQLLVEALLSLATPKEPFSIGGQVQKYFTDAFELLWPLILPKLQLLMSRNPGYRLLVTGHSLGGAVAVLAAAKLAAAPQIGSDSVLFYSFGEPRVGNYDFASAFNRLVPHSWRVVHSNDVVVHVPTCSPVLAAAAHRNSSLSRSIRRTTAYSCTSHFGMPYHHGTEVFFPRGARMTADSEQYRVCTGLPLNEDKSCADALENWGFCFTPSHSKDCLNSHLIYYGIHLGKWWDINRCTAVTDPEL